MKDKELPAHEAWKHLTDLLRMKIICHSPEEIMDLYHNKILPNSQRFQILRFKPRYNTFLSDMIVNFNMLGQMICELQIILGDEPPSLLEEHFMYETRRALKVQSLYLFKDSLNLRIKELIDTDCVENLDA